MKVARVLLLSFLLVAIAILVFGRHVLLPRAQTIEEAPTPCCSEEAPRQLEFPYYSLRDSFSATLLLVSDSPKPLDFVLAVHSRSGQTLLAPAMTIGPQEKLPIDLGALLTSLAADMTGDFAEGSVSVYFNGTIMPLAGQLTMTNPLKSLSLESEMVDNSPGLGLLPPVLNAVWWALGGGRDARIMITNTSGDAATADVFLDFQGERHESTALNFASHETKLLSIAQLLGDLKASPAQAPEGGITIIQRGPKPALIAQGKITDPATGFSTSLNFMDPSVQWASALHASGVPIGLPSKDSPYAGTGVFIPHVIVRNLIGSPQSVTITVEYPGEKGPQQTVLAALALGPYATEDFSLDSAFGLLPLPLPYCSIRIQYSGPPGSVIGEVSSVESKGDMVIDSRLANEGDGWAGSGGHPWHLDDETESVLFLTNMGEEKCDLGFQIQTGGVHYYLTDLSLKPRETRAIDLRKLRDKQKRDFKNHVIPASATDGTVAWTRLDPVPVMGGLVVVQRSKRVVSAAATATCPCPPWFTGTVSVSPDQYSMVAGENEGYTATAQYIDCNSLTYWYDRTAGGPWTSSNTSVARITGFQNGQCMVQGVAGGWATISFSYTGVKFIWCPPKCQPLGPVVGRDSGQCNVCDIRITGSVCSGCTGQRESKDFTGAVEGPSSNCQVDQSSSQNSCSFVTYQNVNPDYPNSYFFFDALGTPKCHVTYFAGPVLPDGSAGTIDVTFTLKYFFRTQPQTKTATGFPVWCPGHCP